MNEDNNENNIGISENSSRQELLEKFSELEENWKISGTPEGFPNVLNIFNITCASDLVPQRIHDKYSEDWAKYCTIRRYLASIESEEDSDEEVQNNDDDMDELDKRFARFQENIYYGRDTMLSFMRMTNTNSAFPTSSSAEMLFWHSPLDKDGLLPTHIFTLYLLGSMFRMRYRRFQGQVFEQIFMGEYATHAWREKCDIKTAIRSLCSKESNFEMWKLMTNGLFESAVKYLTECQDVEFPELKVKRRVWSFSDGIYDATDDSFWFYQQHTDETLVSCKIIEKPFAPAYFNGEYIPGTPKKSYEELDTPLFDSIFAPQEWDSIMIKWMFAFIGRLFYEVNEKDSWQVIPFLKGVAGTGKSTVIKVIQMMYSTRDVGVISNNIEKKFGLSSVFDKTIFIIPELKGDFQMDQAEFQSMVTGEEISMAVKHENPCVGKWVAPGIIAGNESARWEDKSGSICRRIVVMNFPNKIPVETSDPNLLSNIKATEIPKIIRKATLAYNWAVENYGNSDIWTALPPRVCAEKKKLQYSTNPLYAFMNSENVDIGPEEYTLESVFISQLKIFTSLKFPGTSIIFTEDFYSYIFSDYNITVENTTKSWPPGSQNEQRQTYIIGCKVLVS